MYFTHLTAYTMQHSKSNLLKVAANASLVMVVSILTCRAAPPPYPLRQRVDDSKIILVGSFLRSSAASPAGTSPQGNISGVPVYLCKISVDVKQVIKGSLNGGTDRLIVLSYLRTANCALDIAGTAIRSGQDIIWFLRRERDSIRTWVDNYPAMIALKSFPGEIRDEVAALSDPRLAVGYIILNDEVRTGKVSDWVATTSLAARVADLTGWSKFWHIAASVYSRASPSQKETVCLLASHFGACMTCARKLAQQNPSLVSPTAPSFSLLRPTEFDRFEAQRLSEMTSDSLAAFQKAFPELAPRQIEDELYWNACVSSRRVQRKARDLLMSLFGEGPGAVDCIPCEIGEP